MSTAGDKAMVLLTRPAGQNRALAERLASSGYRSVEKPLLEIIPLSLDSAATRTVTDLDLYDDVIFVSGNAVEIAMPWFERYWPQWPVSPRWVAVGAATAARLESRDLAVIYPAGGASEGLLDMDEFRDMSGRRVLIVRGVGGRELLADTLRQRGARVDYLEVYERRPVDHGEDFADELQRKGVSCAVVTSGEALQQLGRLLGDSPFRPGVIVPSARVGAMAIELGFAKVETVEDMSEDAIVRAVFDMTSNVTDG